MAGKAAAQANSGEQASGRILGDRPPGQSPRIAKLPCPTHGTGPSGQPVIGVPAFRALDAPGAAPRGAGLKRAAADSGGPTRPVRGGQSEAPTNAGHSPGPKDLARPCATGWWPPQGEWLKQLGLRPREMGEPIEDLEDLELSERQRATFVAAGP